MKTPILETERLILRPLTESDAETAYKNWTGDPEVARYMSWSLHKSAEDTRQWLRLEEKNALLASNYTWGFVLKASGELIGSGGIVYSEPVKSYELGYNIMKKYWNMGYTTEAAGRIIEFGSETLHIRRFYSKHAVDNPASGRVMEHVGFHYVRDTVYTSLDGARSFPAREYELTV